MNDILIKGRDSDVMIAIRKFPDRKRPVIMIERSGINGGFAVGCFNSENAVNMFIDALKEIIGEHVKDERR